MSSRESEFRIEQYWQRYSRQLARRARKHVGDESLAEDIVAETFLRLLRLEVLPEPRAARGFLARLTDSIAGNFPLDVSSWRSAASEIAPEWKLMATADPRLEHWLEVAAVLAEPVDRELVASLSPWPEGEAVRLRMKGASVAAIARRLRMPKPEVRESIHTGIRELRAALVSDREFLHSQGVVAARPRSIEPVVATSTIVRELGELVAPELSAAERDAVAEIIEAHLPAFEDERSAPAALASATAAVRRAVLGD